MKRKSETDALNEVIILLENKQVQELESLREQFNVTYESFKPINLIKSTFLEVTTSPEIKNSIVKNSIGLATDYITKKVLFGTSHNVIKRLFGTLLQFVIANVVSKKIR